MIMLCVEQPGITLLEGRRAAQLKPGYTQTRCSAHNHLAEVRVSSGSCCCTKVGRRWISLRQSQSHNNSVIPTHNGRAGTNGGFSGREL